MLKVWLFNGMAISMLSFCHMLLHISVNNIVMPFFFKYSATVSCVRSCFVGGKTNPPLAKAGYGPDYNTGRVRSYKIRLHFVEQEQEL